MPPPSVYITVSRSGETWRPNRLMSSPVLPITVISASGAADFSPRRKRAAPTPPASTVMRMPASLATRAPAAPGGPAATALGCQDWPDLPVTGGESARHYYGYRLTGRNTRPVNLTCVVWTLGGRGRGAHTGEA